MRHLEIPWEVLLVWISLLRLRVPDLDVRGVVTLDPGDHFRVDFDTNRILFDASGSDRDQRSYLWSGLLEYAQRLAVKKGFTYHAEKPGRHLRLIDPPTAPIPRPAIPIPSIPTQRQSLGRSATKVI